VVHFQELPPLKDIHAWVHVTSCDFVSCIDSSEGADAKLRTLEKYKSVRVAGMINYGGGNIESGANGILSGSVSHYDAVRQHLQRWKSLAMVNFH
jgi:hypothetical protein